MPVAVDKYFPEINGDLSRVTWVHAVNSMSKLQSALDGEVMMLEADVSLGNLVGTNDESNPIPIMAHPPNRTSDLSLEQFIDKIIKSGRRKGIKLDFKSKEAFNASENILEQILVKEEVKFPVWLNADILPGPVNSEIVPVDADYFLKTSVTKFPTAMLSVGWTTKFGGDITVGNYSTSDIDEMTEALSRNHVIRPVTFPVRAGIAAQSVETLTSLVQSSTPGTTLTLWSPETDPVDYVALKKLIEGLGHNKVYIDIPKAMYNQLQLNSLGARSHLSLSVCLTTVLALFYSLYKIF